MPIFYIITLVLLFLMPPIVSAEAPVFRAKFGMYDLSVDAGELLQGTKLGSLITLQPGIYWNFPSMSSRVGTHFLLDLKSKYGLTPISGIGLSGYYYFSGLPSSYEYQPDEVLVEKTKPSFYTFASITPVNFNLNQLDQVDISNNISFSAVLLDLMIGAGFEYPLQANSIISVDFSARDASSKLSEQNSSYRGFGLNITYTTSYY